MRHWLLSRNRHWFIIDFDMKIFDPTNLINDSSCFDLQFRKDIRKERANSPTYYRWKAQFVVTAPKEGLEALREIQKTMKCGNIHVIGNQARLSVQKISDVAKYSVPYLRKHTNGNKKKEFELWQKAVEILLRNKGIPMALWKKSDFLSLVHIHNSTAKYKSNPRKAKWLNMAKLFTTKI